MSLQSKNSPRQNLMRRNIAALAARIMAEDGMADYGLAKRKAARQLGAPETQALPTNVEIETELRSYHSLYQAGEQRERLHELRLAAIQAMRLLEQFRPYLTGAVLDGTAGRYAEIDLEAFPDSSKDVEIFLLNKNIAFEQVEPRRGRPDAPECILTFECRKYPIRLSLFEPDAERTQRRNPRNGRTAERARLTAVEALLAE